VIGCVTQNGPRLRTSANTGWKSLLNLGIATELECSGRYPPDLAVWGAATVFPGVAAIMVLLLRLRSGCLGPRFASAVA
jgi:hypothetical protein